MAQERFAGIGAGTGRALQDHRAVGGVGRLHDGLHLFHVVDVECRQAVIVFSGVIEQLAQRYKCHNFPPDRLIASQS